MTQREDVSREGQAVEALEAQGLQAEAQSGGMPAWVTAYLAAYKRPLVTAVVLGIVASVFAALMMFASGYLVTRTAEAGIVLMMVMTPIACVQLFGIGKPLAQYFERLTSHDWVFRVTSDLRRKLYEAIERESSATGNDRMLGEVLGMLADDIGHLQNLYLRVVFPTVIAYIVYIVAIVAFGVFSVGLAIAELVLLGTVVLVVPPMVSLAVRRRSASARQITDGLYGDLADNVIGASDWMVAGRGASYAGAISAASARLRKLKASIRRTQRISDALSVILLGGGVWLVAIWAGTAYSIPQGTGEPEMLSAFIFGFFPLIEVFAVLNGANVLIDPQMEAVARLDALIGIRGADADGASSEQEVAAAVADASAPAVELSGVSFGYEDDRILLSGIDLFIPQGQKVAVLGRSGSGKTTLATLLRGDAVPQEGTVRVMGNDVASYGESVSNVIAYVEQSPYLFNRTLRENLLIGSPEATDEQLVEVLGTVGLSGLLEGLERGLDSIVDEAGMRFSGGERHRVALARVLLSGAPVVILDEPTVGLDPATEAELFGAFFHVLADRTLIVITHHLAQVERFDRVLFVEDGSIALDGAPANLLESSERFASLISFDRAGS